jgi:signal transduction histidine kinase
MEVKPVTSTETLTRQDVGAVEAANYAKAILNILDDIGEERQRQSDSQCAVLNILEDIDTEKIRLEATQKALLNILDDFDVERGKVDRANHELLKVNEAMRSFVAVAAHDLRSPLASMVGFSSLLTKNWASLSDENRLKFVTTIDRQSHNLAVLVSDLLTLSSIEGGVLNTQPELIVLGEAITACLAASSGDTASVSVSCSPDLVVRVDPAHLGRIIDNYVQNAFKYGKPPFRIEATGLGDMVEVRVLDHGPGVQPEFESELFGKFARAEVPGTRDKKGTGLGLSIVRGLADANGGQARYQPNVPNGSCFVVLLPTDERPRR